MEYDKDSYNAGINKAMERMLIIKNDKLNYRIKGYRDVLDWIQTIKIGVHHPTEQDKITFRNTINNVIKMINTMIRQEEKNIKVDIAKTQDMIREIYK